MRWWQRLRQARHTPAPSPEAQQAHQRAQTKLAATRDQTPGIRSLVDSLADIRQRNHLAELIRQTFGSRP